MSGNNLMAKMEALADAEAQAVFNERLLTIKRVALIFGVKVTTVREWIARGDLLAIKIGKEYRISETALREYKQQKEEQQRKELLERRRRQELEAQLAKYQQNDPQLKWAITNCIVCGQEPVLITRHMRLDGSVFCQPCMEVTDYEARVDRWILPKHGWERTVSLRVEELNRLTHEELDFWGVQGKQQAIDEGRWVKPYFVYRCPLCSKPREITPDEVKDPSFYPQCYHERPFGIDPRYHGEVSRDRADYAARFLDGAQPEPGLFEDLCWHPRVVADFARLESNIRNHEDGADDDTRQAWSICLCASCGRRLAVARHQDRIVGDTRCRLCISEERMATPYGRLKVIHEVVKGAAGDGLVLLRCKKGCEEDCELVQFDEMDRGVMTLLSVCSWTSRKERSTQVNDYADFLSLSPEDVERRLVWAWEIESLDDLPF